MGESVFSLIAQKEFDSDLTVFEDDSTFSQISLHQKPKNRGHVLVIPKMQVKDIYELPAELDASLMSAIRLMSRVVKRAFNADGIQVRQNNEAAAGQDVFHLHFHIIPRFSGDQFDENSYEEVLRQERSEQAELLKREVKYELANT